MRTTLLWSALLAIVLFAACGDEADPPTQNNNNDNTKDTTDNDTVELCDTIDVNYTDNIKTILTNYCAVPGCHVGSSPANGYNFSTYAGVSAVADKPQFLGAINHESNYTPMPYQEPKLSAALIEKLTCWVKNGLPEN